MSKTANQESFVFSLEITTVFIVHEIILAILHGETKVYDLFWTLVSIGTAVFFLICIIFISYCYGHIYLETWRQIKRFEEEHAFNKEAKRIKEKTQWSWGRLYWLINQSLYLFILAANPNNLETRHVSVLIICIIELAVIGSFSNPIIYS